MYCVIIGLIVLVMILLNLLVFVVIFSIGIFEFVMILENFCMMILWIWKEILFMVNLLLVLMILVRK